ncbi:uncharacterized protein [Rutidosis leptorrhynchoides]|uniref:uncharacterized protein n=1 Tax=Rutidosis leptorrhynchoides TaxID=125765 RepID=UPI003A9A176D
MALIGKWWWRIKSETTSLWVKVIASIYGKSGGLMIEDNLPNDSYKSTWKDIIKTGTNIEDIGLSFRSFFVKEIGDEMTNSFWNELWIGNEMLKHKFKRLARLETNLEAPVGEKLTWDGEKCEGNWSWLRTPSGRAEDELQQLKTMLLDVKLKPQASDMWKKKRLPVLVELVKRGIDLHSVRCPLCDDAIETVDHSLILCKHVSDVWCKVWGRGGIPYVSVEDLFLDSGQATSNVGKFIWQALVWSTSYLLWKNRNQKVFSNKCWNITTALNEIQIKSFE